MNAGDPPIMNAGDPPTETVSERMLARVALSHHAKAGRSPGAVLVCGLGLGHTALELLRGPVEAVHVVEREQALVDRARQGLTPTLASIAGDGRTHLHVADVADFLAEPPVGVPQAWQAILLDVDNGPDVPIHDHNAWWVRAGRPGDLLGTAGARRHLGRLVPGP